MAPDVWYKQYMNCLLTRGVLLKTDEEDWKIAIEMMTSYNIDSIFVGSTITNRVNQTETFTEREVVVARLINSQFSYFNQFGHDSDYSKHSAICKYGR